MDNKMVISKSKALGDVIFIYIIGFTLGVLVKFLSNYYPNINITVWAIISYTLLFFIVVVKVIVIEKSSLKNIGINF